MEVTGIRVRKRKKRLYYLKEKIGYWKLKEGRTSSQSVENSLWKRLWTCKTACKMNDIYCVTFLVPSFLLWLMEVSLYF